MNCLTIEEIFATAWGVIAGNDFDQSGFPGSVVSHQADNLALFDGE